LQRDIKLRAEAATGGGRHDAYLFDGQAQHLGRVVAVHIGRLGAGDDDQHVAIHVSIAGFRLDIGMLDEGGLDGA